MALCCAKGQADEGRVYLVNTSNFSMKPIGQKLGNGFVHMSEDMTYLHGRDVPISVEFPRADDRVRAILQSAKELSNIKRNTILSYNQMAEKFHDNRSALAGTNVTHILLYNPIPNIIDEGLNAVKKGTTTMPQVFQSLIQHGKNFTATPSSLEGTSLARKHFDSAFARLAAATKSNETLSHETKIVEQFLRSNFFADNSAAKVLVGPRHNNYDHVLPVGKALTIPAYKVASTKLFDAHAAPSVDAPLLASLMDADTKLGGATFSKLDLPKADAFVPNLESPLEDSVVRTGTNMLATSPRSNSSSGSESESSSESLSGSDYSSSESESSVSSGNASESNSSNFSESDSESSVSGSDLSDSSAGSKKPNQKGSAPKPNKPKPNKPKKPKNQFPAAIIIDNPGLIKPGEKKEITITIQGLPHIKGLLKIKNKGVKVTPNRVAYNLAKQNTVKVTLEASKDDIKPGYHKFKFISKLGKGKKKEFGSQFKIGVVVPLEKLTIIGTQVPANAVDATKLSIFAKSQSSITYKLTITADRGAKITPSQVKINDQGGLSFESEDFKVTTANVTGPVTLTVDIVDEFGFKSQAIIQDKLTVIPTPAPQTWGYSRQGVDARFPDKWAGIYKDKRLASVSPVNVLAPISKIRDAGLVTRDPKGCLTKLWLVNTGNALTMDIRPHGYKMQTGFDFPGAQATLVDISLHAPSEHSLNGKAFPAEVQLSGIRNGSRICLVFFIRSGGFATDWLDPILDSVPRVRAVGTRTKVPGFVFDFQPTGQKFVSYRGAETTPPAFAETDYFICTQPLTCSFSQLERLTQTIKRITNGKGNNRPLQQSISKDKFQLLKFYPPKWADDMVALTGIAGDIIPRHEKLPDSAEKAPAESFPQMFWDVPEPWQTKGRVAKDAKADKGVTHVVTEDMTAFTPTNKK